MMLIRSYIYICRNNKFPSISKKDQTKGQLKILVSQPNYVINTKMCKLYKNFKHFGLETDKDNVKVTKMYLQKMILRKINFTLKKN